MLKASPCPDKTTVCIAQESIFSTQKKSSEEKCHHLRSMQMLPFEKFPESYEEKYLFFEKSLRCDTTENKIFTQYMHIFAED